MSNPVTIRLGDLQLEKLKTEAKMKGKTLSEHVRSIVIQREKTDQKLKDLAEKITALNNLEQDIAVLKQEVRRLGEILKLATFHSVLAVAFLSIKPPHLTEQEWAEIKQNRDKIKQRANEVCVKILGEDVLKIMQENGFLK